MEKYLIPEFLSPNAITVIGQIPALCLIFYVLTQFDLKADGTNLPPAWVFYAAAASLQWFSFFDNADGVRARRLKCGSPVGRIIDEALDFVNMSIIGTLLVYGC